MRTSCPRLLTLLLAIGCQGEKAPAGDSATPVACGGSAPTGMSWDGTTLATEDHPCGDAQLQPSVLGSGDWTVDFVQTGRGTWQPTVTAGAGGTFEGLLLSGPWQVNGASDPVFWKQGYQSWSWSGVTLPGEATLDVSGVLTTGGDGDGTSVSYENDSTSWWAGLVGRADGASLLIGVESADTTRFFMGLNGEEIQAVWGHRGDSITLAAGETLTLDPLWFGLGSDPQALWEAYGDNAAAVAAPRGLESTPPTGWATWYQYYSEVTEADVRENLDALVALQSDTTLARVDVFQIDDGWQLRWGDWWAGSDFPSGMAALASDISAAGMTPGLWLAPLYMSTESDTYTAHPDWWVLDEAGEPIRFSNLGTGDYVILDVTHPDAADWLRTLIADTVAQGYRYLKLDFLYAGAMPGQRHANVTGMQAYHIGMSIMREAAGDAWILACGAPFLPSLGYAESFRTGADIAFELYPDPDMAYYRWQARSTAARAWTHGRWWWMDPDQIIVRSPLTEAEVRGSLASALVAGGTWMLGDDLVALDDERLALSLQPDLTSRLGQRTTPADPLTWVSGIDPGPVVEAVLPDDQVPTQWTLEDGTVVLLNLTTETIDTEGPGGTNLLTGETAGRGTRQLQPGDGEVWAP